MGKDELEQMGPEAIEVIREESGHQGADWECYLSKLEREHTATAYLFRCRHCGQLGLPLKGRLKAPAPKSTSAVTAVTQELV